MADTYLTYHPQWPPVKVRKGVVLIDDTDVSVWADRADLLESTVNSLSVETWLNKQSQVSLALSGKVSGPAMDGLKVLNESPLAGVLGSAFADWTLAGDLETDLELWMNLSDKSAAPRVDVATRWRDVDLTIMPGNLHIKGVTGEFDYSTTSGFNSRSLAGELWGKPVFAILQQHHDGELKRYDPATTVVDIELATRVDLADLRGWLHLDLLAFASGKTDAEIGVRLTPGEPPVLTVESNLQGASLDLPHPWQKSEDETQPLYFEMPMAVGVMPLSLDLGKQLRLRLDVGDGQVRGGALGINVEPQEPEAGVLRVTGHSSLIQGDDWLGFVTKYLFDGEPGLPAEHGSVDPVDAIAAQGGHGMSANKPAKKSQGLALDIRVDEVRADSLVIREQELKDVTFSLAAEPDLFSLSLDMDWLRTDLTLPQDGGPYLMDVEYLDLDRLPELDLSSDLRTAELDLPRVGVTLGNVFQSDQRLGDLAFELYGQGRVITAENITGELAQLRLRPNRPGRLVWQRGEGGYTQLQASLGFEDLGHTLEYFGYQRIVETVDGDFNFDLRWPGAPGAFSLAQGQGSMKINIGSGSFLEASSGATGALRVASILNLADIVRRLSLSQMFESGIPFDSVTGEIFLHEGTLEVAYMDVKGGSSFQFSGISDIESQSLGGELVATLPVANNLPWIAALAASLPVAAGVFVVSRVFNKQMNRLSSAVYTIGGLWDDPEVDFDRIFDNTDQGAGGDKSWGAGSMKEVVIDRRVGKNVPSAVVSSPAGAQPDSP